ncbi:hypothetical protein KCTC32516_00780 [Polaribacter huanghezhanensis]|uniref:hypothetical protein n=1 Tax=Polaribacter huanghezhanensis TaxID=1354726 RepID=UPI0026470209|nr:hypothetical protein [Polaribacter huanghezhanensis]WKD85440.1 hypothetical protein KCTC32516_00780 [Polaribacter huanghezhanensis]
MKNQIYLLGIILLLPNFINSQENKNITTNIKLDSLKGLIKDEVKKNLDDEDSIEIGFFSKVQSKVRIFTKKEGEKYKKKEHLDSLRKEVILLNSIVIDSIKKDFVYDSKKVLLVAKALTLVEIKKIDGEIENIIDTYNKNKLTLVEFQTKTDSLYKEKEKIIKRKVKKLKKDFGSIDNKKLGILRKKSKVLLDKEKNAWDIEKITIDVFEGLIIDLVVTLKHKNNNEVRKFTNNTSISIVRFRKFTSHKLFETNGSGSFVRVKDVLDYTSKTGLNYFPENALVEIGKTETTKSLFLKRNLKSILDFRIYTDLLGLLDEESNGIINFEASSTIKISPSPIAFGFEWIFFKEIKPYFNYSRFDKQDRAILTDTITATTFEIKNKLHLIRNAFIKAGFELNVLQIKSSKEFPFAFSIPFLYEFNMTEVGLVNEKIKVNTYQMGSGLNLNLRRTKSFGLNLGMSYSEVKNKHIINSLKQESSFHLLGFNSEIYFYNPKDQNSAFFLRLNTKRVIKGENNYSSIQFGYKKAFSFSK